MKILLIGDHEEKALWDDWSEQMAARFSDIDLILSAGDLDSDYLEFLVTMMNIPLVYVHGNHDQSYLRKPPQGCIDADGKIVEIRCGNPSERIRILGLGGSMRYNNEAPYMFTEKEMQRQISRFRKTFFRHFDVLLTHAPCKGYGDLDDLPHQGFECFNDLLNRYHPKLHVYGHIHRAYGENRGSLQISGREQELSKNEIKGFQRMITHPSGTILVNADSYYVFEYK